MLWRHYKALLKLFCRNIFLQSHRFNADDGFGIDVSIVKLVSGTNVDHKYIEFPQIFKKILG
jgi:hypothetical protein